jgi:hypothetical protein
MSEIGMSRNGDIWGDIGGRGACPAAGTLGGGTSPPLRGDVPPKPGDSGTGTFDAQIGDIIGAFPIWFEVDWKGQWFRPVSVRPHIRADGSPSSVVTWSAACVGCGLQFQTTTGRVFTNPTRRCVDCRSAPRVKVGKKARAKLMQGGKR